MTVNYISGGTRSCRQCTRKRKERWRQTAKGKTSVAANNQRLQQRRRAAGRVEPPTGSTSGRRTQRSQRYGDFRLAELRDLVIHEGSFRKASNTTQIPVPILRELVGRDLLTTPTKITSPPPISRHSTSFCPCRAEYPKCACPLRPHSHAGV